MHAVVHPADIQDRDGGKLVLATLFGLHPFLRKLFADGGYQGPKFKAAEEDFAVPGHRNRQALRSGEWLRGHPAPLGRRADFENLTRNALAFIHLASVRLMVRKLCLED